MTFFELTIVLKMSGPAWEKIAQRILKKDEGRVTKKVETRLIASLHHIITSPLYFIQALIFSYFSLRKSDK
jgi:hypothetical protein